MACPHEPVVLGNVVPKGEVDDCRHCGLELIFDGRRWRWIHDLSRDEVRELRRDHQLPAREMRDASNRF